MTPAASSFCFLFIPKNVEEATSTVDNIQGRPLQLLDTTSWDTKNTMKAKANENARVQRPLLLRNVTAQGLYIRSRAELPTAHYTKMTTDRTFIAAAAFVTNIFQPRPPPASVTHVLGRPKRGRSVFHSSTSANDLATNPFALGRFETSKETMPRSAPASLPCEALSNFRILPQTLLVPLFSPSSSLCHEHWHKFRLQTNLSGGEPQ
ncbi:hypothetical protein FB45DRAFT_918629 [Roridomyces roridus]|uniref:Uncharacterized protein n=1 Tax=Roridomyces roridus TaxID=1738132 RepID=A0AAD7BS69_9AGAR|nr:hypothetical protein FB45DRAFT_918629 [Roridomyces roridus]